MTNGRALDIKRHFVLTWLPWILGLAALGLYVITLNRSLSLLPDWMTFFGAGASGARIAGWSWQSELFSPAYFAATYPLRWLPPSIAIVATNLFSALCAALVLVQLARSVALLPHDRTRDQRDRTENEHALLTSSLAWLPPVFAVLVCALGLGFWEHSTNGTVEMFDLLLFAYVVRSFLEYRINNRVTHLYRTAFVFGVGMSGNPAMIAFFPLFVIALVWSRQLDFFNLRFLAQMATCGLAGLLFYLLLPAISSLAQDTSTSFWDGLRINLLAQKHVLTVFPRKTLLLLSLTSVLPIFLLSIRWASQFGDPSRIGAIFTTVIFHVCHIVVLLACLWVAFDPPFSPRKAGLGFAFLPLYFLGALSVGYYSGYLLLISRAISTRLRPANGLARTIQLTTTAAIGVLLAATLLGLTYRNYPQIRITNGPWKDQLADNLVSGLPPNGILLSDEPKRVFIVEDWLARHGRSRDFVVLNTQWLTQPEYHKYLQRRYPNWSFSARNPDAKIVPDVELIELLQKLAKEKSVSYLHPSFGYYFEHFIAEPHGLSLQLKAFPTTSLLPPPLLPEVNARNEKFWADRQESLKTLLPFTRKTSDERPQTLIEKLFAAIQITPQQNRQVAEVGALYSRSLVNWGVALQRAGEYEKAGPYFELAQELNPENMAAQVNLETNQKIRAGKSLDASVTKSSEDWFGKYRSWREALAQNGPFDEPMRTYAQGFVFAQGNLPRQAAQEFNSVRLLATNDLASRLWLAQLNLNHNFPDAALAMASEVRNCAERTPGGTTNLTDLFTLEASAYFVKNEPETATRLIEESLKANPDSFGLLGAACRTYADYRRFTNALDVTERMIALQPENTVCWLNRGCFLVELGNYDDAIKSFDRVINAETNYTAILYRAIASLRFGKLDEALRDYETVQRQYPQQHQIYYGLGEIAYRRKDTNVALRHYESYLSNSPPDLLEANFVVGRIRELRGEPADLKK